MPVRHARAEDAPTLARMLHDFNLEFGEPSPGTRILEPRIRDFIANETKVYLLTDPKPDGFAQLSFNASVWTEGPIALIEELYVIPESRRRGLGRSLMEFILDLAASRDAGGVEVITGEDDFGARALYESFGFRNEIEGEANARALFYELDF